MLMTVDHGVTPSRACGTRPSGGSTCGRGTVLEWLSSLPDTCVWYTSDMIHLTPEQVAEIERHPDGMPVEVEGSTKKLVLVEWDTLRRLRADDTRRSLERAFADIEAGRLLSPEDVEAGIRAQLSGHSSESA
jgi:hypothetical protein